MYEVPEKPSDALSYLKDNFVGQNVKELQETNEALKSQNTELVLGGHPLMTSREGDSHVYDNVYEGLSKICILVWQKEVLNTLNLRDVIHERSP